MGRAAPAWLTFGLDGGAYSTSLGVPRTPPCQWASESVRARVCCVPVRLFARSITHGSLVSTGHRGIIYRVASSHALQLSSRPHEPVPPSTNTATELPPLLRPVRRPLPAQQQARRPQRQPGAAPTSTLPLPVVLVERSIASQSASRSKPSAASRSASARTSPPSARQGGLVFAPLTGWARGQSACFWWCPAPRPSPLKPVHHSAPKVPPRSRLLQYQGRPWPRDYARPIRRILLLLLLLLLPTTHAHPTALTASQFPVPGGKRAPWSLPPPPLRSPCCSCRSSLRASAASLSRASSNAATAPSPPPAAASSAARSARSRGVAGLLGACRQGYRVGGGSRGRHRQRAHKPVPTSERCASAAAHLQHRHRLTTDPSLLLLCCQTHSTCSLLALLLLLLSSSSNPSWLRSW